MAAIKTRGSRKDGKGAFIYNNYEDNHVIWPGKKKNLKDFLQKTFPGLPPHKMKNAVSSNSEDALTWSCFDVLKNVSAACRAEALGELWELAYGDMPAPAGFEESDIQIGKKYENDFGTTEVDLSFERDSFLVFVEAKLYSPMSQADPDNGKPLDQIARKLTIGLREAQKNSKDFYFILLDIAPLDCLSQLNPGVHLDKAMEKTAGFGGKWLTSYWFCRYKHGHKGSLTPLKDLLSGKGLNPDQADQVAEQMGWLTWADVFKIVLRAVIPKDTI